MAVFFAQEALVHQLVLIVAVQQRPVAALLVFAVPNERAIHQRVFQPFGGVHGDDFHQRIVAFQPQLLCFAVLLIRIADLVLQPLLQGGGRGAVGFGSGQEFTQLPEVGEAALLAALQQAGFQAAVAGKLLQGGVNAVLLPVFACGFCPAYPLAQRRFVAVECL